MVPSLNLEGILGSLFLVLLVIFALLAVVTGSVGGVLYLLASGIENLGGSPPPDAAQFFAAVGAAVLILGLAAVSR